MAYDSNMIGGLISLVSLAENGKRMGNPSVESMQRDAFITFCEELDKSSPVGVSSSEVSALKDAKGYFERGEYRKAKEILFELASEGEKQ